MKRVIICFCLIVYCIGMTAYSKDLRQSVQLDSVAFESLAHKSFVIGKIQKQIADMEVNKQNTGNLKEDYMKKSEVVNYIRKIGLWMIGGIILCLSILTIGIFAIYKRLSARINKMRKEAEKANEKNSDMVVQLVNKKIKPIKSEIKEDIQKELKMNNEPAPDVEHEKVVLSDTDNDVVNKKIKPIKTEIKEDILKELKMNNALAPDVDHEKVILSDTDNDVVKENFKIVYAKPMQNGCLKEMSESAGPLYVIHCYLNDMKGEFKVYEGQEQMQRAIKNKEDCLDLFCIAEGSSVEASAIRTLSLGEVERKENGIWSVVKKVKIEFVR